MNEHTHPQIETLSEPEAQSQIEIPVSHQDSNPRSLLSLPNSDSNAQISHPESTSVDEASHTAAAAMTYNPQNPSKIPIRPQKMRKLSKFASASDENLCTPQTIGVDSHVPGFSSSTLTASTTGVAIYPVTPAAAHASKNRRRSASLASRVIPQVIKPLSTEGEIDIALAHLRVADPLLGSLIDAYPPPQFETHPCPFIALTKSILYQQLALKAGTSIYTRFIALCGCEESICPDSVLALSPQQLKQIGVSGRKASYLYDLANKYKSGILSDETIVKMDDRSLFTMLSMVKGIGSWSVHMFMIFSLQRPDVLPVSDLGVRKGVQLLYGLEELPRPSHMEQLCEKWKPYRSVASWYLWRFMEGKGSPSTGSAAALEGGIPQPLQQIDPQQDGHQHQLQFVETSMGNIGACIWNQLSENSI